MLNYNDIYTKILKVSDKQKAVEMSAYMRNKFSFLGVPAPERKNIQKQFFKNVKNEPIDWAFVEACWDSEYREFQYIAKDYLVLMQEKLTDRDIPKLKNLITQKSWWDSTDGLDTIVGFVALSFPKVNETLLQWSVSENIWLRRVAIDHQLKHKEKTNSALLSEIIKNNFGTDEFFINKAIGWSLRAYSKINPKWVKSFITENKEKISNLSVREASKYLD